MPIIILANNYIISKIINSKIVLIYKIIFNFKSIFIFFEFMLIFNFSS